MSVFIAGFNVFLFTCLLQTIDAQANKEVNRSSDSLLQYASSNLVKKCDSSLSSLSGNPDSAMFSNAEKLEVKHFKYVKMGERTYFILILGCGGNGELLYFDSTDLTSPLFVKELKIPGKHVVFEGASDLNGDGFPELRLNFSAGAHGMYASFLTVYKDSTSFIKTETGNDKFFANRGGIQVVDVNGDGISEIKVNKTSKLDEVESFHIYEWDGKSYKIQVVNDKK